MDYKLFIKTYPYVCDFCDKCGAEESLRKAYKQDIGIITIKFYILNSYQLLI